MDVSKTLNGGIRMSKSCLSQLQEFLTKDNTELVEDILKTDYDDKDIGLSRNEFQKKVIERIKSNEYDDFILNSLIESQFFDKYKPNVSWEVWSAKFDKYIETKMEMNKKEKKTS